MIGVPPILLGDYLAKSRAMFLPNAYLERSRLDRLFLVSVPQIDLSARTDRKMVIFYIYLHYFTKKSRIQNRYADKKNRCAKEKRSHTVLCVSAYLYTF